MALKQGFDLIRQCVRDFSDDDCPTMAAALSYYTIFSLPPLLVLILLLLGAVLDQRDVQNALEGQIGNLIGGDPLAVPRAEQLLNSLGLS